MSAGRNEDKVVRLEVTFDHLVGRPISRRDVGSTF
jgi:hypothetical protein